MLGLKFQVAFCSLRLPFRPQPSISPTLYSHFPLLYSVFTFPLFFHLFLGFGVLPSLLKSAASAFLSFLGWFYLRPSFYTTLHHPVVVHHRFVVSSYYRLYTSVFAPKAVAPPVWGPLLPAATCFLVFFLLCGSSSSDFRSAWGKNGAQWGTSNLSPGPSFKTRLPCLCCSFTALGDLPPFLWAPAVASGYLEKNRAEPPALCTHRLYLL